jgi:LL-diaminopimelate aminotransferase
MMKINENYGKLPGSYLFTEIAHRTARYTSAHPGADLIKLGIGDATQPLAPAVTAAIHEAVDEMGKAETFRGYGPEQGYGFLRDLICDNDYNKRGIDIASDEIFISDGAKSDCGNIGDIFDVDNTVAVCDPVYPVYVDTNAMAGRAGDYLGNGRWSKLEYLLCNAENGFVPDVPSSKSDIIYLCFPNNPTGAVATREQLKAWVDYARKNESVILFDAAYEAYIAESHIPHSIYEIDGAKEVAIEFRSFSKTAGFTGTRCAFTVVPKDLKRGGASLRDMWNRRQCTKFNGVPYIVQKGAAAVYSAQGKKEVRATIDFYMKNAEIIRKGLSGAGLTVFGGINSPYIWVATPKGIDSWAFFDMLLEKAHVITTPGSGFGPAGEGYIRLTGFGGRSNTEEAVKRVVSIVEQL